MSLIPGFDGLTAKIPELGSAAGLLRVVLTVVFVLAVALALLLLLDQPGTRFLALVLQLLLYIAAYQLLRSFYTGPADRVAYAVAFYNRLLIVTGLNLASLVYILVNNGREVIEGQPPAGLYGGVVSWLVFRLVALYLVLTAAALFARALQAAGADTLAGVYVYYQDEGEVRRSDVYSVLRHPAYAAMDRLALAFGLWNGSPYALLLAVLFVAVWHPAWYRLEERELEARFGEGYTAYRDSVPAVVPRGLPAGELRLIEMLTRRSLA